MVIQQRVRGQCPEVRIGKRAELSSKAVWAGLSRLTQWQSPGLKKMTQEKKAFTVMSPKFSGSSLLVFPFLKQQYFITANNVLVQASHTGLWCYIALKI